MYYGNTKLVPIPESSEKGKVIVAKTGYVYLQVGYTWDSQKRQPIYKRRTIGKQAKKEPDKMYFSKDYEEIFGTVDVEVELLRKKYGNRELRLAGKLNLSLSFGPFAAVEAACQKAGCLTPLKRVFNSQWKLILALCVHAIVDENTTSQAFPGWCFTNYCGLSRVIADSEISKLYRELSDNSEDIKLFFNLYWEEFSKKFPESSFRAVGFDSTNQNYGGKGIPWAKLGHAKVDVGLPIINMAMFVDENTGIPLWYECFDGSILDKSQTPFSLKKIVNIGYKKLFVVFDRGYYSEEGLGKFNSLSDIEYGVLCPDGTKWVEDLIRTHGPEIKDKQMYYIPDENTYGAVYEVSPFESYGNKDKYYAYLFYDSERASVERDTIHEVVSYFWNQANARKRYTEKMSTDFGKQGIIVVKTEPNPETGKNFMLLEDTQMIQELLDMKGFFVMISSTKMYPSEAIHIIRKRDMSEKAFALLMRHFNLRTTGRKKKETYEGMMFMAFIGLICLTAYQHFEKSYLRAVSSRTIATTMMELLKYQINWNFNEETWEPGYAMSKEQKQILGNLNLTEVDLQKKIEKIEAKLTTEKVK